MENLQKNKLNIIKSPTGSGKTYFALTAIPSTVADPSHKIVYLIDTINGKQQILHNYNARPLYSLWENEVEGINFENDMFETDNRIVIITYAKFGIRKEFNFAYQETRNDKIALFLPQNQLILSNAGER